MDNTYKNYQKPDSISKVSEPETDYIVNKKAIEEAELHPILVKSLEKSIKEAEEGKTFSHEEVIRMTKERYPFLK